MALIKINNKLMKLGGKLISTASNNGQEDGTNNFISLDDNFVGYYADTDGDGEADGVIFFDYAHGADTTSGYSGAGVAVTAKTSGLANYKLIDGNVVQKVGAGDDRFYVIDLEDTLPVAPASDNYTTYWYKSAYTTKISDYDTVTSTAFGTGKINTATMKAAWNAETYGDKNNGDMWSNIHDGKFVLSKDEWSVLGSELKKVSTGEFDGDNYVLPLTTDAGVSLSLNDCYWSSSLDGSSEAWYVFMNGPIVENAIYDFGYVRLASTF